MLKSSKKEKHHNMKALIIDNLVIECFEEEKYMNHYLRDNKLNKDLVSKTLYFGKLYETPQDVRERFEKPTELMYEIKKQNYEDVQYVLIHEPIEEK